MSLYNEFAKNIPEYYPTMYMDGFKPEQIVASAKKAILNRAEERKTDASDKAEAPVQIIFKSEVKVK